MKRNYIIPRHLLDGVEAFLRVAERQSFRAAAEDLGISASAISQTVRQLEERMGVPLFIRTTRSVGLTEAGAVLRNQAAPAWTSLIGAWENARTLGERPAGLLRLNMPEAVVPLLIEPILADFCARYPDVDVEIIVEDARVDLAASGHDAGIRIGELLEADMICFRLSGPFRYIIVGAPDYLDRRGRPQGLADLKAHDCIRQRLTGNGAIMPWRLSDGTRSVDVAVKGRVMVNNYPAIIAMATRGLGLAQVSEPLVADQIAAGTLEVVLCQYAPTSPGLFLHYPDHGQMLPKLRAFIDHVKAAMASGVLDALR
ncbi:LysR family transcriptional regulator [Polymorphobacter fuscus]|uniref:LysR family transcriptional regulator n=1 Tax=Sandarakinorhabdus fusca TaxID=1439888 RepID=A0A7C9KLW1_9SPHN|nr:LysR family transcriptional regulator [Polymorphobacter fuscus]KAB7646200.1 LysR family transcriptional regulator [Polymorphobacter fuscus]MQT17403.1 LysR family transcriptional regulator [Polymorphobacter fuscus]NJC10063.1 DNA-binding transcriptional LysR family regulator [Polymorphobacter fuscus]